MKPVSEIAIKLLSELKKELYYLSSAKRPRKVLFDHIPKCGGSTLSKYLKAHYPRRKVFTTSVYEISVDRFKNYSKSKRYGYDYVDGHLAYRLSDYVHPESLKVTVLREPIDRIVSHYYYAKREPQHFLYSKIHEAEMSLEDYIGLDINKEMRNWYTIHFSGMTEEDIEKDPIKSINVAVEKILREYDIIGFLEDFSSFTETLREQASLKYIYKNDKVNVTRGRVSVNDLPQSTVSKIEQINQLDIELYKKIKAAIGKRSHLRNPVNGINSPVSF